MMFESLHFGALAIPDLTPRFNICPTQSVLAVRQREKKLSAEELRWGLVPFWAKELKIGAKMINARSETVASKPAFRSAFKSRRCLIIADGFFEWKKTKSGKQPYFIGRSDSKPYVMAGLWESWKDPQPSLFDDEGEKQTVETCTIITTSANRFMAPLHDRMPVILNDNDAMQFWLDPEFSDHGVLEQMLESSEWTGFESFPVSRQVNFVRNDGPELIIQTDL